MKPLLPLICLLVLSGCVKLDETGEQKFIITSVSQEIEMGEQGYAEVLAQEKKNIITTGTNADILQRVGSRIAQEARQPEFDWEYTLIESEQMNAWCMPGGKIAVYTGILPLMKNEAGMAAVMGHEVAHATLRHSGQRISQQMGLSVVLGAISGGLGNSPQHDEIMALLGAGASVGVMLPYSRSHESEADRIGLKYMAMAGYDPEEAVLFWQRFKQATQGQTPPEFLSTHPGADTRIDDLKDMLPEAKRWYKNAQAQHGKGSPLNVSG